MPELLATPLNSKELLSALKVMIRIRQPAMTWGPPGIGKSQLMRQLTDDLGIGLVDVRAILMNPVDVNGLPYVQHTPAMQEIAKLIEISKRDGMEVPLDRLSQIFNSTNEHDVYGQTFWSRPGFLPAAGSGILLFDELPAAPVAVQAALYQVMLDYRIGDHVLGKGWVPFGAGNRMTDRAVAHKMPSALSDRMFHFDLIVEFQPWLEWAVNNNIHPLVVAYLKFSLRDHGAGISQTSDAIKAKLGDLLQQPMVTLGALQTTLNTLSNDYDDDSGVGMLHRFNPASGERSFPTPRSWEKVSDALYDIENNGLTGTRIEEAIITGKVGPTGAKELLAFAMTFRLHFSIDDVVMNPDTAVLPDEPSLKVAVAASLARHATPVNLPAIGRYIERMDEEYQVLFVKSATARDKSLYNTHWLTKFNVVNADIMS